MKNTTLRRLVISIGCVTLLAASTRAEDMTRYRAKPSTNTFVRINGSANVHDWEMEGSFIGGSLELPASIVLDSTKADLAGSSDGKLKAIAHVSVNVSAIVNAKYDGMSQVMQDAMDATNFPAIVFDLTDLTVKLPHAAGKPFEVDTKGQLAIKGVTNKISFPVTIESLDKTRLKISASGIPLKMSDYKVTPPVKYGLFVTSPDIKISFDWIVGASAPKPAEAK